MATDTGKVGGDDLMMRGLQRHYDVAEADEYFRIFEIVEGKPVFVCRSFDASISGQLTLQRVFERLNAHDDMKAALEAAEKKIASCYIEASAVEQDETIALIRAALSRAEQQTA